MTRRQATADAASPAGLAATLFLVGVLVALNVVVDRRVYDVSQLPRLLALLAGLLVAVAAVLVWPGIARRLDWRPLGQPLVVAAAGFLLAAGLSLTAATNVSAGFTDLFRTLASFLVLCLGLLLLPLEPRWQERLLQTAVIATLVAVGVGGWEIWPLLEAGAASRRDVELAFLDGMMSNVNLFAGYLLLLVPWCVCARCSWPAAGGRSPWPPRPRPSACWWCCSRGRPGWVWPSPWRSAARRSSGTGGSSPSHRACDVR